MCGTNTTSTSSPSCARTSAPARPVMNPTRHMPGCGHGTSTTCRNARSRWLRNASPSDLVEPYTIPTPGMRSSSRSHSRASGPVPNADAVAPTTTSSSSVAASPSPGMRWKSAGATCSACARRGSSPSTHASNRANTHSVIADGASTSSPVRNQVRRRASARGRAAPAVMAGTPPAG